MWEQSNKNITNLLILIIIFVAFPGIFFLLAEIILMQLRII